MGTLRAILLALLLPLLLLCSCATAKDSNKHFSRPKYKVREHARDGVPAVAQTWWSSWWFWQRNSTRKPAGSSIRLR